MENTYKFHFVSKVVGRMVLRINFFRDTTLPTFPRRINLLSRWKKNEWNKIRNQIFNVAQHWYNSISSVETTLNQRCTTSMQSFFNVVQCHFNVVSTMMWHYLNVVSRSPQRQLKLYQNQCGWCMDLQSMDLQKIDVLFQ